MSDSRLSECRPLIVEDDPDFALLVKRGLEKVGISRQHVRSCDDGEAAITLLSADNWIPSFVLLDLHMPRLSGLEVLEWIRSRPFPLGTLPVFMMTSSSEPDHVARAFQLGVGSYFIKPLDIQALENVLEGIVAYWSGRYRPALIRGSLEPLDR